MTRYLVLGVVLLASSGAFALEADGRVVWGRHVVLSTPVSGMVVAVPVTVGDRVSEGAALVRLEQGEIAARLTAAEKAAEWRRQAVAEAGRELERTQALYDRTLLSDHDLQVARIAHAGAEAELAAAAARLERARLRQRYSVVRAPFAGVVLERRAHPGMAVVNTHQALPLMTLVAARPYTAVAQVSERWGTVEQGTAVTVEVGGERYPGTVVALLAGGPDREPPQAGYRLEVRFDGPAEDGPRPGQAARIVMP